MTLNAQKISRLATFAIVLCCGACSGVVTDITEPVLVIDQKGEVLHGEATASLARGGSFWASSGTFTCSGTYDVSIHDLTITIPTTCSDGRTGTIVATREASGRGGSGTVTLSDGTHGLFGFGKKMSNTASLYCPDIKQQLGDKAYHACLNEGARERAEEDAQRNRNAAEVGTLVISPSSLPTMHDFVAAQCSQFDKPISEPGWNIQKPGAYETAMAAIQCNNSAAQEWLALDDAARTRVYNQAVAAGQMFGSGLQDLGSGLQGMSNAYQPNPALYQIPPPPPPLPMSTVTPYTPSYPSRFPSTPQPDVNPIPGCPQCLGLPPPPPQVMPTAPNVMQ